MLAEVLGWESTCDAFHVSRPEPSGGRRRRALVGAIHRSGLSPSDVAAYCAHGTGTIGNDALGIQPLPARSRFCLKSLHGHAFAASAVLEAIVSVMAIRMRALPPVWGFNETDPALKSVDVVSRPRPWVPGAVLSASFGLGGVNTAIVLAPWIERDLS